MLVFLINFINLHFHRFKKHFQKPLVEGMYSPWGEGHHNCQEGDIWLLLRFEFRASNLLDNCSTTWPHPNPFCFSFSARVLCFCPRLASDHKSNFSCVAEITGKHCHACPWNLILKDQKNLRYYSGLYYDIFPKVRYTGYLIMYYDHYI
jgi:hypothetical protein